MCNELWVDGRPPRQPGVRFPVGATGSGFTRAPSGMTPVNWATTTSHFRLPVIEGPQFFVETAHACLGLALQRICGLG